MTSTDNPTAAEIARNFLSTIFEPDDERLPRGCIAVWSKASKMTRLSYSADDAAEKAFTGGFENVSYFGVCARDDRALRERARDEGKDISQLQGSTPELCSMPGVWIDIDIRSDGHKKKHLCPDTDEAFAALLRAVPIGEPTVTVWTGGGIHAYYLFAEGVVEFEEGTERSREKMERLCQSIQAMVRDELHAHGWSDDQTWGLPRVMRIPGGQNLSHGQPRPVTWRKTGPRYSIDDLWMAVPADLELAPLKSVKAEQAAAFDDRIKFDLGADPTSISQELSSRMYELCEIDDDLRLVWERKRRSLPSQSEMDLSLATRLAAVDMPVQEIVDLLRYHRMQGAATDTKKVHRADYYLSTIQRAFASVDEDRRNKRAIEECTKVVQRREEAEKVTQDPAAPPAAKERAAVILKETSAQGEKVNAMALEALNSALGLKEEQQITLVKYAAATAATRSVWLFQTATGAMFECTSSSLFGTSYDFLSNLWSVTGAVVEPFTTKPGKKRQWAPVLTAIRLSSVDFESGDEATQILRSVVRFAVDRLLGVGQPAWLPKTKSWGHQVALRQPCLLYEHGSERAVIIDGQALTNWIDEDPQCPAMARRTLRLLIEGAGAGCRFISVQCVDGSGKKTSRSGYLRVPRAVLVDHGPSEAALWLDTAFDSGLSEEVA
ncbi:hypothetical protein K0U83_17375 [bacterium]|nr:hypothetical protein [bacterium]